MSQEKQCTCCLRFLPLSEFHKDKNTKSGVRSHCKECAKDRQRKFRQANAEKVKERNRKYREANPEKVKETYRKYREANAEKEKERSRKYYEANVEKMKEYYRKYYEANAEKEKERNRKRRESVRATETQQAVIRGIDPSKLQELKNKLKELDNDPR